MTTMMLADADNDGGNDEEVEEENQNITDYLRTIVRMERVTTWSNQPITNRH